MKKMNKQKLISTTIIALYVWLYVVKQYRI